MFKTIKEDIATVFNKDPAARSTFEVLFCYPGLHAIWMHRIAHFFWQHKLYFLARFLSHLSRFFTGIEIHPGATIGRRFFIDHGAGIVIGETTLIGDEVLLYQGVVLGGTSLEKKKRHPTLGNNVLIGAGAIVLGPVTIADGARIGAGSVVIHDIPPNTTAVGIPARVGVGFSLKKLHEMDHTALPDPIAEAVRFLEKQIEGLEKRLQEIEHHEGIKSKLDMYLEEKKKEILQMFASPDRFSEGGGI
jgi:serine O-acetyltransferase